MAATEQISKAVLSELPSTTSEKLAVLSTLYQALVGIAQELRQTTERLTLGGAGLSLFVTGWMLSRSPLPSIHLRAFASFSIVSFSAVAVAVIRTLQGRYNGVAEAIRNVNHAQGAHLPDVYLAGKALLPPKWRTFGTKQWREPIFLVAYVSWTFLAVASAVALLLV